MKRRLIAQTGIEISPLGLGTVKFGRNQGVKYPQGFELPADKEVRELLALAFDLGINLLDTAPAYGLAEERLGKLLPNSRHDWVIETKVGESFLDGESRFDFTATGTRRSVENSLRLLKTDYLDMVLIHSDGDDVRILRKEAVLDTLLQMQQQGWVRTVGISSKTVEGGLLAFELGCDVVMAAYNPTYTDELPVLEAAAQQNKAVLVKKAFASGHLDKLGGENPVEQALAFAFAQPGVTGVVLGTINPRHLRENVAIAKGILV
ncbi:MAG TPA: aldo/keto reductase [Candidatus Thiothrix moscowensis]|uniref:aldo/keto reductase n=1 Tax=unclassified Thiothrix TaxID=2636184 RepID=UPI0025FDCBAD|nr:MULTISPECIES: aldo/keto reductase [unclassified Thiothrix]HRJ53814.1 aldo/keto reductase [Candidatus Thiothrix moscowensis]HRJ93896.1 aldo/keto reductase [Candidatus Thiothrix moscowensis]